MAAELANGCTLFPSSGYTRSLRPQPVVFRAKQTSIPVLTTIYHFTAGDSIISEIQYNWISTDTSSLNDPAVLDAFIAKYDSLNLAITRKLGQGMFRDHFNDRFPSGEPGTLEKLTRWVTSDTVEVGLYLTFHRTSKNVKGSINRLILVVADKNISGY